MEPDPSSLDLLLLLLAGPLGVLAAIAVLALLGVLVQRTFRRFRPARDESDRAMVASTTYPDDEQTDLTEDTDPLGHSAPIVQMADEPAATITESKFALEMESALPGDEPGLQPAHILEEPALDVDVPAVASDESDSDADGGISEPAPVEVVLPLEAASSEESMMTRFKIPEGTVVAGLLILILLIGAYFRFIGLSWDEDQHLHPDERFITMAAEQIHTPESFSLYFDTERSPLNPFSTGSYTYGMFPLFLTRYVAEWLDMTGYDRIVLLGRALSGIFDLAAVGMLYLLGVTLYNRRVALLAAALSAAAVLPIQLSHYFAVDTFSTVFIVSAFYLAVLAHRKGRWWHYALFGALTGMAMACKVTTAPLLGIIGLVSVARVWQRGDGWRTAVRGELAKLLLSALMAGLFFRIFQPYAFEGPGFFDLGLNERWLGIMKEVRNQVSGRAEWPPNHHWTNRPMLTFAWRNLAGWGVGLPLGIAATLGWIWAAFLCWRGEKGEWRRHLLPVVWVGGYFAWQNMQFWRYMRYFMPIYPLAILLAAWALAEVVERTDVIRYWPRLIRRGREALPALLAVVVLGVVVAGTFGYAFAFTRIYTRPHTRVQASRWMLQHVPGPLNVVVDSVQGRHQIPISMPREYILKVGEPWVGTFKPTTSGPVAAITTMRAMGLSNGEEQAAVEIKLLQEGGGDEPLAVASITLRLGDDEIGQSVDIPPVRVEAEKEYHVVVEVTDGGPLIFGGARLAVETSWDDTLPLRIDGTDPLGSIYQLVNLELFEPDSETKRERMLQVLDQADYIVISSNRAYDAMPRLPLRYPMTTAYYQALFDCPSQLITTCAYPANPPLKGPLGFELVSMFESYPNLGPITLPDDTAEEAFTVYDHPKVLLFEKSTDFSLTQVRTLLERVDVSGTIEQGPVQYTNAPTALQLPPDRWSAQTSGGTWSATFDWQAALNRHQWLAVLAWYGLFLALGWVAFPLFFIAVPALPDKGYPLSRIVALLVLGWLSWISASLRLLPFTRASIWLWALVLVALSVLAARRRWREIELHLRNRWRSILLVEGVFLALFVLMLAVRWNNPDLWQPWRGGEKPMNFSYLNAVIKSTEFPPYDPWMSGGILNYYYYGYVLVAMAAKMLGVVPSVAYNLSLPSWFAMTGLGAFSMAYNLAAIGKERGKSRQRLAYFAGVCALLLMVLLGNLFQVGVLWNRLAELGGASDRYTPWLQKVAGVFDGVRMVLSGESDLIGEGKDRWFFAASRAILHQREGTPITEFPYFSFLYADLHPHLLDMPIILAALSWMLSLVVSGGRFLPLAGWLLGGLILGATYPTHTWDFPTLGGLGVAAVVYAVWLRRKRLSRESLGEMGIKAALFLGLAFGLYYPFRQWFGSDYVSAELWQGPRSPLKDYLTVHGLFLLLLASYLAVLTSGWVRSKWRALFYTPLGVLLPRLWRIWWWILAAVVAALYGPRWLLLNDYRALVAAVPLLIWTLLLLLSGYRLPRERFVLALIAAGLGLTALVEVVVLKGDVGRSNTVFKFYLQVWTFFSVAAGASLIWTLPSIRQWRFRRIWRGALALLVLAAALYPLLATPARVSERWPQVDDPPRTLDGMAYMLGGEGGQPAIYQDEGRPFNLALDHGAIRWMQENVIGTPVIVEGQTPEYRWGTRYAKYTGLPTVVGWSWHLRQHNSVVPGVVVERRIEEVRHFYNTTSTDEAVAFLRRYQVEYVVVGELERAYYSAAGLEKLGRMAEQGELQVAYKQGVGGPETGVVIYRVNQLGEG